MLFYHQSLRKVATIAIEGLVWLVEYVVLEIIQPEIAQVGERARYVAVKGTMLRLAHMLVDAAGVVATSMMLVTVRKGSEVRHKVYSKEVIYEPMGRLKHSSQYRGNSI